MKNKGFTLIELLAVIVVLAIVALITVPTVLGVIEKTKKSALKDSAYGLIEAANIYYAQYGVTETARFDIENGVQNTEEKNELSYKGNIKNGTVLINNKGKIMVCVNEDGYSAYKNYSQNEVIAVNKETCYIPENNSMVYLEQSGKTLSELTNQELTDKIEELENKINQLQQQLNNKTDSSSLNNLSVKHESDISNIWNKVGTEDISSLNGSISNTLINHDLLLQNVVTKDLVSGLRVNYADNAGSVEWGNISNKPTTFTPSSHTHNYLSLSGGTISGNVRFTSNNSNKFWIDWSGHNGFYIKSVENNRGGSLGIYNHDNQLLATMDYSGNLYIRGTVNSNLSNPAV